MRGLTVLIPAVLASIAVALPAFADEGAVLSNADRAGIEQTVLGQMDAFQRVALTGPDGAAYTALYTIRWDMENNGLRAGAQPVRGGLRTAY